MAQILINIPDFLYKQILKKHVSKATIARAFQNGVVLPKGHGALKDVDDLDITTITTDDYSGNEVLDIVLKEDIDNAPTIIEADKINKK